MQYLYKTTFFILKNDTQKISIERNVNQCMLNMKVFFFSYIILQALQHYFINFIQQWVLALGHQTAILSALNSTPFIEY